MTTPVDPSLLWSNYLAAHNNSLMPGQMPIFSASDLQFSPGQQRDPGVNPNNYAGNGDPFGYISRPSWQLNTNGANPTTYAFDAMQPVNSIASANSRPNSFQFGIKNGQTTGDVWNYTLGPDGYYRPTTDLGTRGSAGGVTFDTNDQQRIRNIGLTNLALIAAGGAYAGAAGAGTEGAAAGAGTEGAAAGAQPAYAGVGTAGAGAAGEGAAAGGGAAAASGGLFGSGINGQQAVQIGSLLYGALKGKQGQQGQPSGGNPYAGTNPITPLGQLMSQGTGYTSRGGMFNTSQYPADSPSAQMWRQYSQGLFGTSQASQPPASRVPLSPPRPQLPGIVPPPSVGRGPALLR